MRVNVCQETASITVSKLYFYRAIYYAQMIRKSKKKNIRMGISHHLSNILENYFGWID